MRLPDERCKQLMAQVGMPDSHSLLQALKQVALEVEIEMSKSPWTRPDPDKPETMPEVGQKVIAYGMWEGEINGTGQRTVSCGVWEHIDRVVIDSDAYDAYLRDVEWWMPIPDLPTMEGE